MTTTALRERRRPREGDVNHDVGQAAAGVQARHERVTRGFDIARVADDVRGVRPQPREAPAEGVPDSFADAGMRSSTA